MTEICIHHWRIETPHGRTCGGVCKRCGASREFVTAPEGATWFNDDAPRLTIRSSLASRGEVWMGHGGRS